MKYKIKKGRKFSFPPLPLLALGKKKTLTWKVTFNESNIYVLGNQSDIQKLCGIGWFPSHHTNSARFGWRWVPEKSQVEILAYCYDNSIRLNTNEGEKSLGFIDLNKEYTLTLNITDEYYQFLLDIYSEVTVKKKFKTSWIGFYLRPYFEADGAIGAPNDMIFNIIKQ